MQIKDRNIYEKGIFAYMQIYRRGNLFIYANIWWVIHVKGTFAYMQMSAKMKGLVINSYRGNVDLFMHI